MSETYLIKNNCTFQPPAPGTVAKIKMPVVKQGNPPTPMATIFAFPGGNGSGRERLTTTSAENYAEINFSNGQFQFLKDNVNTKTKICVEYIASSDSDDARITGARLFVNP